MTVGCDMGSYYVRRDLPGKSSIQLSKIQIKRFLNLVLEDRKNFPGNSCDLPSINLQPKDSFRKTFHSPVVNRSGA